MNTRPLDYNDIGHYSGDFRLWMYTDGRIVDTEGDGANGHTRWNEYWAGNEASGRVDFETNEGSVVFSDDGERICLRIIDALVDKFPGIKFWVFAGKTYTVQEFYEAQGCQI